MPQILLTISKPSKKPSAKDLVLSLWVKPTGIYPVASHKKPTLILVSTNPDTACPSSNVISTQQVAQKSTDYIPRLYLRNLFQVQMIVRLAKKPSKP
mmetsp:Transcript_27174/g.38939  ORF Transcript_27174/g.38939 Transcript_27174/m.38939 type:complete len:97 (+) Transcript_27174:335-625(+)